MDFGESEWRRTAHDTTGYRAVFKAVCRSREGWGLAGGWGSRDTPLMISSQKTGQTTPPPPGGGVRGQ